MPLDRLSALPTDVASRIVDQLDHTSQLALMRTSKELCGMTRHARRFSLDRERRRPGRMSDDPFPTLFEYVQRGGTPGVRPMHLQNLLRECAPLPPGDGLLQAAAKRHLKALPHMEHGTGIEWNEGLYWGERDAQQRPHGVGYAFSKNLYDLRSVYIGDWWKGQRSGYGVQFFWEQVPALRTPGDLEIPPCVSLAAGWYEGQWHQDRSAGMGLRVLGGERRWEGRWVDGYPVEDTPPPTPA